MKRSRLVLFTALLFSIAAAWSPAPAESPRSQAAAPARDPVAARVVKELQAGLPAWVKEKDVPGVAVAVVDDKEILWQGVYGFTSRAKDKPVTPRTLFSIQSMSKSFTALAVLMAVQDGLLDLDRPITEYLPNFTVHSRFEESPERKMTLRHLLSHRAGFTHEAPVGGNFDSRPHTFSEHILSISDTWLRYPVGYRYSYSNLGVDLAGWLLEKKSGEAFTKYVREKVLMPLGMSDSTLDIETILKTEDRAVGHVALFLKVAGGIPVEVPMVPAGGVYTNILDMARYLMFHINKGQVGETQLLRKDLIEAMHTVQFPEKHERFGYGLGLVSSHIGPQVYLTHGGGGYGFTSYMAMYPGLKLGVVVLTNADQNSVTGPVSDLVNEIIQDGIGPPGREYEIPTVDTKNPIPATDERVQKIAGSYAGDAALGTKDGAFGITRAKQFYPLAFYTDGDEVVGVCGKYSELRAKPPLGEGEPGTIIIMNRLTGTCEYGDFHKPEPAADKPGPNKPEWKPFLGTYKTLTWGRTFGFMVNIAVAGGYLTFNGTRCREHLPGLFFTCDGEALDFRGTVATFRNILLIRTRR
ncbi:MAG: serine hydrolase [Candidatus Aminicenantes bacterium]|nr:serine hydrolase [Candidatus Aminicenantes bacterium]